MNAVERTQFVQGYGKLLRDVWNDGVKAQLQKDPVETIRKYGLDPGAAKVVVVPGVSGKGTLDDQIRLWEEGLKTGMITLYVPFEKPAELADMELSEADLEAVAGGSGDCCCSCTPCCCC